MIPRVHVKRFTCKYSCVWVETNGTESWISAVRFVIVRKLRFAIRLIGLWKRIGSVQDFVNEAVRGTVRKLVDRGYPQRTASLKMSFKTLLWLHFWKIENNLLNCIALCFFNLILILFFNHKIKSSQSVLIILIC
jgi:hypothetical protein